MKACSRCQVEKPLEEFHKNGAAKDGKHAHCKTCSKESYMQWHNKNRNRRRELNRQWYYRHEKELAQRRQVLLDSPEYRKKKEIYMRKFRYGITEDQYQELLNSQKGRCAICKEIMTSPWVDHDHQTNEIRGLLCRLCNTAVGMIGENVETLKSMIKYLERFHKSHTINLRIGDQIHV